MGACRRGMAIGADIWPSNRTGAHVDSYYSRSMVAPLATSELTGAVKADVVVIGAGFAGVNTALSLASRGRRVVVLEGNRIGWAASGRNGGFAHPGFSLGMGALEKAVGTAAARALWNLTFDSLALMRKRMEAWRAAGRPEVADSVRPGMLTASWFNDRAGTEAEVADGNRLLGRDYFQLWDRARVRDTYATTRYYDAVFDPDSFHFHSLNYGLEVARDAMYVPPC